MAYRHVLLAVDFSEHSERAVAKAEELARRDGAELSLIHVVEYLPTMDSSFGPVAPFDVDLTEQLLDSARRRLGELADRLAVPDDRRWVEMGSPKAEILRIAEEQKVDLIVVGSHGHHGLMRLLGSTASSVVHNAECDVLAVRL